MPWIRAVTAIRVVVARIIPSNVRKLRSLFLRSESTAMRVASQKEAVGWNRRVIGCYRSDENCPLFVPHKPPGGRRLIPVRFRSEVRLSSQGVTDRNVILLQRLAQDLVERDARMAVGRQCADLRRLGGGNAALGGNEIVQRRSPQT